MSSPQTKSLQTYLPMFSKSKDRKLDDAEKASKASDHRTTLPTIRMLYRDKILNSHLDRISLTDRNITRIKVDAVVNSARPDLLRNEKGTVDYDIHKAAGPGLAKECKKQDGCKVGQAKLTDGYKLTASYIIHTVGPVYDSSTAKEKRRQLENCYRSCFHVAVRNKLYKIALPLISVGQNGYPLEDHVCVALESTRRFLSSAEGEAIQLVVFVTRSDEEHRVFRRLIPNYFPDAS